jgi:capsular polysaccharide biosynthesis protein
MVPKTAIGMSSRTIVAGSLIAGLVLAVFAAVALDLAGGRVLESWQIERTLRLPVLGEARALR